MRVPLGIAWRYVFSKRKLNVINLLTLISVLGIAISTAAMVIVMSAFNGVEHLVQDMYGASDPDIRITPSSGKTFLTNELGLEKLLGVEGIRAFSPYVEETVIIKHNDLWKLGKLKGIASDYLVGSAIGGAIIDGNAQLTENDGAIVGIAGAGLMAELDAYLQGADGQPESLKVYGLEGSRKLSAQRDQAVNEQIVFVGGVFQVNPKFDTQYLIVPLEAADKILSMNGRYSGIEVNLLEEYDSEEMRDRIAQAVGAGFEVKTRFQQNELIFQTNRTEKKITFLVLIFIFVLSTFNLIAVLAMMILEKKRDILVLRTMGLTSKGVRRIFISQGVIVTWLGALTGIAIGLIICFAQIKTGFVTIGGGVMDAYPIKLEWQDFALIFITVFGSGFLLSVGPVWVLVKRGYQAAK